MEQSAAQQWASFLEGEALVLGLLGRVFYEYPERAWLQNMADEDIFVDSPLGCEQEDVLAGLKLLQAWSRSCRGGMPDEAFDEIRADYTRLFIGPGTVVAPPWESAYVSEERLTFQEETLQVRAWYLRFGLQAAKLFNEPDDHIGLELAFAAHLARLGTGALERQDAAALPPLLDAQRAFLAEHLLKWAPGWCELVAAQARTELYRGIALLTRGALAEVSAALGPGDAPMAHP